jgi:hypothetical protein
MSDQGLKQFESIGQHIVSDCLTRSSLIDNFEFYKPKLIYSRIFLILEVRITSELEVKILEEDYSVFIIRSAIGVEHSSYSPKYAML